MRFKVLGLLLCCGLFGCGPSDGGLPALCARQGPVRFLALGTMPGLATWVEAFNQRYQLDGAVLAPLDVPEHAHDAHRAKYIAQALAAAVDQNRRADDSLLIAITPEDLFIADLGWNWAFAFSDGRTSVLSTARMEPRVDERLSKLAARTLGSQYCWLPRTGPPQSVMRAQVLSVQDLDEIDGANWQLIP